MTEIEIRYPVFRCATDEDVFYQRLARTPGVEKVLRQPECLLLIVLDVALDDVLLDLRQLCDIWHAAYRVRGS